jgi:uncharacterized protein (TIGR02453 family)
MPSAFPGFPPEGLAFFRNLVRHNDREWFQPRKPVFDQHLKLPMRELVTAVNTQLQRFAPEHVTDPDKAIYRIYRDTRFSPDKTPYKTHIAAAFPPRGLQEGAGYYFAVSHKEVAIGGGLYTAQPQTLLAVRQHIAAHHERFRKLTQSRGVQALYGPLHGEQLSRVPKGFPKDHPAADLLRFKRLFFYVTLAPELATTPALYTEIVKHFKAIAPFLEFLNAPIPKRQESKKIGQGS